MNTNRLTKRVLSLVLALLVCLSCVFISAPDVAAAAPLPSSNNEARHTVCHALSAQAKAYYTGNYTYSALRTLPGATYNADSSYAMRNNELFDALHDLMADTHTYYTSYSGYSAGSLAYYWAATDSVANSSTYVMFYSDIPSTDEGVQLNREHIWPKSRASYATTYGGADLHHLRPAAESVNMDKSDHMFGYVDGTYSDGCDAGVIDGATLYWLMLPDDLFECKNDVKGDVARILLYVYCRWLQPNLYSDVPEEDLPVMDKDDTANNGKRVIESLDTLLNWCALDPVDTWEMKQNDLIQQVQGNRNVFIDYPELAWQLFGLTAPNGMTTPTKKGCAHDWQETSRKVTCGSDASFTLSCSVCGDAYTRRLEPLDHIDADNDEYCDVCAEPLAVIINLAPVTTLKEGMHFVLYHPASGLSIGKNGSSGKLVGSDAYLRGSALHPLADTAVMIAQQTDGGWHLLCDGQYLTTGNTGNSLKWVKEPTEYSIWNVEQDGNGSVYIVNLNAAYNEKAQAIEYYNNLFTAYSKAATDVFRFRIYAVTGHVWSDTFVTFPATCESAGTAHSICLLCGKRQAIVTAPPTGHTPGEWKVTKQTSYTSAGEKSRICTTCGKIAETQVIPKLIRNGWFTINGNKYYYKNDVKLTGWQNIKRGDGKTYKHYLGTDGAMRTGWQTIKNADGVSYKYYFGTNGCMVTGWQTIKNSQGVAYKYYFGTNGVMRTGWQSIKNSQGVAYKYYFGTNGVMRIGWQSIKNSQGVAYKYYFRTNGTMVTGWQTIKNSSGVAYKYYFRTNGTMVTGWQSIKNSKGVAYKYYFGANGVMRTGWQSIKNSKGVAYKYYFRTNGTMVTGWQTIKNSKGVAYKYYFRTNGTMVTGWQTIKNSKGVAYKYYFRTNGTMVTGNYKIGSKTYKFNSYGVCLNP